MSEINVRGGSVIGRDHLLMGKNRQDAYSISQFQQNDGQVYIGILADGCGSTPASEVGANLLTRYMLRQLERNLKSGESVQSAITSLFCQTRRYIRRLVKNIAGDNITEQKSVLHDYFLATVMGFVTEGDDVVIFVCGDGTILFGDYHLVIDQDNKPTYLAYSLFDPQIVSDFKIYRLSLANFERIAIATDGFEVELVGSFWNKPHPNGVQRLLNAFSKKKHFVDDATLITIELAREEAIE